jgi:hypothetical protein
MGSGSVQIASRRNEWRFTCSVCTGVGPSTGVCCTQHAGCVRIFRAGGTLPPGAVSLWGRNVGTGIGRFVVAPGPRVRFDIRRGSMVLGWRFGSLAHRLRLRFLQPTEPGGRAIARLLKGGKTTSIGAGELSGSSSGRATGRIPAPIRG